MNELNFYRPVKVNSTLNHSLDIIIDKVRVTVAGVEFGAGITYYSSGNFTIPTESQWIIHAALKILGVK